MMHVQPSKEFHNHWYSSQSLAQILVCFMFLMSTTVSKQLVAAGALVREGGQWADCLLSPRRFKERQDWNTLPC